MKWGGVKYKVLSLEDVRKEGDKYQVVITIANNEEAKKVAKKLEGLQVTTVEEVMRGKDDDIVENNRQYIADFHFGKMDDYFVKAEETLKIFWDENCAFYKMFSALDLSNVVELACGRGRHVTKYLHNAKNITLVDILAKNISYCQDRFSLFTHIDYYVNNGYDFKGLKSGVYSAVFSYDAMVHFEFMDIFEYLKETKRILKPGGRALFHHSNNTEDYKITFSTGASGRNYMSAQLFAFLANRAGLKILEQKIIDWGGIEGLDCISLLEKEK